MPREAKSISASEDFLKPNLAKATIQAESDADDSGYDTISALFEIPFDTDHVDDGTNVEEIYHRLEDVGSCQYYCESPTKIVPQDETLQVIGAGNPAVNGIYRWFAAHDRFVMLTDRGQYQITGGVSLYELGDGYHDCWVIEEIMVKASRLYALPSRDVTSSNGWICINGASPAPKVKMGESKKLQEDNSDIETQNVLSLSGKPTDYLAKMWSATEFDGVDRIGM